MNGHTWSMTDLDRIAKGAAANNYFMGADFTDLYHAAWSAVVDLYYASEVAPTRHQLATEARAGIWRLARDVRQTYGYRDRDPWNGVGSAPRFAAYWTPPSTSRQSPFEDRILDGLALDSVWACLRERDREILTALAVHEDNRDAAAALGMPTSRFSLYLSEARRRVAALWHDWETPHRSKGYTSRRNHRVALKPCGTPAAYDRHLAHKEPPCEPCSAAGRERDRARKSRSAVAA